MEFVAGILGSLSGTATAAGTAAAGTAAAGVGASTAATILSGSATALSVLMGIGAADQEATAMELAALDAETEQANEQIQGLQRRNALKAQLIQAVGEMDVAYAASGVDLSFGTPVEARREAARAADRALAVDSGTTLSRVARLDERARLYRIGARRKRRGALLSGVAGGLGAAADIAYRG